ncbi:hypothetical protein [Rhodococcus sp. NPDC049939]|uniref:hypothetical protein n=1 Tax=Rhodococcus sp. NPDC049939 TaxID=3155511 RepID=UPI0033E067DD
MNEAALGVHASSNEPATALPEPPEPVHDDSGGGFVGVSLPTLLAVARLTPPQTAQLLTDLSEQLELTGRGGHLIALRDDTVMVSDDGQLTIDGVGSAVSRIEMNDAVASLLRDVATNCRGPEFGDLVIEPVSEATDPEDLVRRVRRAITPELDPAEETRRRRQIGELVKATIGRPPPHGRAMEDRTDLAAGSLTPTTNWYPPGNAWHTRRRRPWRQGAFALLAIGVVAGAVVTGPHVWAELKKGWDIVVNPVDFSDENTLRPVSPPPAEPVDPSMATDAGVEPASVQTGAPTSAGQITGVTASFADGSCNPGQTCEVRVDVGLDPAATVDTVTWKLNVYDRCTGEVHAGGDVTMRAEPGRDEVYGLSKTFLPPGHALAVAAVTSAPAVAASEPLYVPAEKVTC